VFKGLKKSNSDSKLALSDRLSFTRKSKNPSRIKNLNSPLPPRLGSKTNRYDRACENIPENIACGPSLHSPRRDPDMFDNVKQQELLQIKDVPVPGSQSDGLICPGCHQPFDIGKRRMLLDSCGHERCYSCLFLSENCPLCRRGSSASQPVNSSSQQDLYISLKNIHNGRCPSPSIRSRPPSPSPSLFCPVLQRPPIYTEVCQEGTA